MHRAPLVLLLTFTLVGRGVPAEPPPTPPVSSAAPAHAHAHNPAAPSPDRAAQTELGASAALAPDGTLWAVHKVSGHIAVSRSPDRGRAWSNPILVTAAPEPTDAGSDARPKIALGPEGELYLTWTRPLSKPYTGEIRFTRSLDGGRTFSPPLVVHQDRQEITHRFDALAINARGQVFVAWIDKRDLIAAGNNPATYRGAALYFAVSDDRGATFRGDFKAADHACECCRIALAPQPDASVSAMWRHIFAPNTRDHALATLRPDGTASALRRASFDEWKLDACPHHGPALATDSSARLHAVWFTGAPPGRGIFYGRPSAHAIEGQRRIGNEHAAHADLALAGDQIAIAWKAFSDGRSRLRALHSPDAGRTWLESELASVSGASDHPRVLASADGFVVFWNSRERPLAVHHFPAP